jgi:hypothetical protein
VLWLPDEALGILIESKGNKQAKNPLGKTDHGQLLVSAEWFKREYPSRACVRVQLHPTDKATESAMAQDTLALTFDGLGRIVSGVRALLTDVCLSATTTERRLHLCQELLKRQNLTPQALIEQYFTQFRVV